MKFAAGFQSLAIEVTLFSIETIENESAGIAQAKKNRRKRTTRNEISGFFRLGFAYFPIAVALFPIDAIERATQVAQQTHQLLWLYSSGLIAVPVCNIEVGRRSAYSHDYRRTLVAGAMKMAGVSW